MTKCKAPEKLGDKMRKQWAFERCGKRIQQAEIALRFAYQRYYREREEAEKELQKVLGEINAEAKGWY